MNAPLPHRSPKSEEDARELSQDRKAWGGRGAGVIAQHSETLLRQTDSKLPMSLVLARSFREAVTISALLNVSIAVTCLRDRTLV